MKNCLPVFCIALGLFFSCTKQKSPKVIREVEFPVGFMTTPKYTGVFYESDSAEAYFYFAEPVTNKCIKTFTLDGVLVDSIPLNEAVTALGTIGGIAIFHPDTILINSLITGQLMAIDRSGKIWMHKDLSPLLETEDGNQYELTASLLAGAQPRGNSLFFRSAFSKNDLEASEGRVPKRRFDYSRYYYQKSNTSPYFVVIDDIFSDAPSARFGLENFYSNLSDSLIVPVELPFFKYDGNQMLVFSNYSDEIFRIDPQTLQIQSRHKIESAYSPVMIEPPLFEEETIRELDFTMARTKGIMSKIFYNPVAGDYYVIAMHSLSEKNMHQQEVYRPFSVLVYDEDFKKKNEYIFPDQQYIGFQSILTPEGLMLAQLNEPQNGQEDEKTVFTIFDFSE